MSSFNLPDVSAAMNSTTVSLAHLSAALKQFNDATADAAKLLCKHVVAYAATLFSSVFDMGRIVQQPKLQQQLDFNALRHALLLQVSHHIFGKFRSTHLTANPADALLEPAADQEALLLQLQLDIRRAERWLQLANAEADTVAGQQYQIQLEEPTAAILDGLLSSPLPTSPGQSLTAELFLPKIRAVVAAAVKAQVICSAMHSQLMRLYVPGWQQQQQQSIGGISMCKMAPIEREGCVQLLDVSLMEAAKHLPAATGVVSQGVDPLAVFCCEPAVIQLAKGLEQLPEFAGTCDVRQQPIAVFRKAKMCVAHS